METAMYTHFLRHVLSRLLPAVLLAFGGAALAQEEANPPARVASLSHMEGSVVFAPAGETEWADATLNRPVTQGDRLWTDKGSRAELHVGSAALHLDGQTFLDIAELDEDVLQASLNEGTVNARVREIERGENFEIDTPQLAFRATQPGDYRIDVDPARGTTRVTVRSGAALVYGANGEAQQLEGPQVVTFSGKNLERVNVQASPSADGFDRWAADRNRAEDQSVTARYVPREVVGYQQLDTHGSWSQDASYGAVWYPRAVVADWAPYRYGHWEFIHPWGWTWIDDAPWGFAPFHYGRWAMIGSRWAWVPGRIGPRPVYAPALVAFVGGSNFSISIGSGPGIGWFPLGPGEAWYPTWRVSPRYVTRVNSYVVTNSRFGNVYVNQQRPTAITTVREADFRRGQPVHRYWRPVREGHVGEMRVLPVPTLPPPQRFGETRRPVQPRVLPPPQLSDPAMAVRPQPIFRGQANDRRDPGERQRPMAVPRPPEVPRAQEALRAPVHVRPPVQAQEPRFGHERQVQPRIQPERVHRDEQVHQPRVQREQQLQMQVQRQQEEGRRQQQMQAQREHALRQQQAAQERAPAQRQQQAQIQQQQEIQQQRALRPPPQVAAPASQPRMAPPMVQPQGPRGEVRERGRATPEQREESRSQRGEDPGRGRGHGFGRFS